MTLFFEEVRNKNLQYFIDGIIERLEKEKVFPVGLRKVGKLLSVKVSSTFFFSRTHQVSMLFPSTPVEYSLATCYFSYVVVSSLLLLLILVSTDALSLQHTWGEREGTEGTEGTRDQESRKPVLCGTLMKEFW